MLEALLFELTLLGLDVYGWLTLAVVLAATVIMAFEKLGPDLVMFSAICVLVVAGAVDAESALIGFAKPETVTIGVLFAVAQAVKETGVLHFASQTIFGRTRGTTAALLRLTVPTAFLSAFLNNTPIVTLFVPMVRSFTRRIEASPSTFLIPLSFAAMLGGTCTLIGTSTNLVVSGLMTEQGMAPIGMFELAWVGLPTVAIGLVYLTLVAPRLLPEHGDPMDDRGENTREYLAEVRVEDDSPLRGSSVEDAGLRHLPGLFLVEIRRSNGDIVRPVAPEHPILGGDRLVFTGDADTIQDVATMPGLVAVDQPHGPGHGMYEVVISHNSGLVGRTVRASEFRRRFGAAILAVHRSGERIEGKIGDIVLASGDTLLLTASPGFRRAHRNSRHFYLVSEVDHDGQPRYDKMHIALFALGIMVVLPAATDVSMTVSSMAAVVILLATQCLSPRATRDSVNWPVLMLIGSAFGISAALEQSGAAVVLADLLIRATEGWGPMVLLAGVYVLTALFSCFISNAAAAALVFPVAIAAAHDAGIDPRPFAIAVTMAASAAFATPIGYQTNLLVYGPGRYRYLDFTRAGIPLNVLCFAVAMMVVPWVWPLAPLP